MQHYKGIDLSKNKSILNYIDTYHILDRDNYETYLEDDRPLQELVKLHFIKEKVKITLFNLSIYIVLYIAIKGIG